MFRIGEFSKITGVSIRMLRYYDECGLLKPAQTDTASGYRLYTSTQVETLQRILLLRGLDYHVKEMRPLLENWTADTIKTELQIRRKTILTDIEKGHEKLKLVDKLLESDHTKGTQLDGIVKFKTIPQCRVLSLRRVIPDHFDEYLLWEELAETAKNHKWPVFDSGGNFSIYHDAEFRERDVDVEVCVVTGFQSADTGDVKFKTLPEECAVSIMVPGPFENINPSYLELARWLERHEEYHMLGTSRVTAIKGPWNEEDPAEYLTELFIPLRPK